MKTHFRRRSETPKLDRRHGSHGGNSKCLVITHGESDQDRVGDIRQQLDHSLQISGQLYFRNDIVGLCLVMGDWFALYQFS